MTIVPIASEFISLVRSGAKKSTIRKGIRPWAVGPAIIRSNDGEIFVSISQIKITVVSELTESDAGMDGFRSLSELLRTLRAFYPILSPTDTVTIAYFRTC
jgi:hypothetical protein